MKILNQHKISRLGPNTEFIESLCVPKISDWPVNSDIIMVGHGAAFFEVGGWDVIISAPYSLLVRAFRKSGRLGVGGEPTYMTHLTQMGLTGALLLLPIQICNWLIFSEPADKGAERQKRQLSRFSGARLKNSIGLDFPWRPKECPCYTKFLPYFVQIRSCELEVWGGLFQ